jgi:NAD(P)-dependent dehydrogenase (short-subunit alcohol dehydrogenase family)
MATPSSAATMTVAITGAASGIGAETARLLSSRGASVIALDRNKPDFPVAGFVQIDLADPDSINAAAQQLPDTLTGLCNVAGVPGTVGSNRVARINYLGLRQLTEAVIPKMVKGGSIVNVASTAGQNWRERQKIHVDLGSTASFTDGLRWLESNPVSDAQAYPYFKEALIVWTMGRAVTLRRATGIRMNCVSPGPTDTPILNDFRITLGSANVEDAIHRAGGVGRPEDIAPVIAFLLTTESAWVVGANLLADGGLLASRILD